VSTANRRRASAAQGRAGPGAYPLGAADRTVGERLGQLGHAGLDVDQLGGGVIVLVELQRVGERLVVDTQHHGLPHEVLERVGQDTDASAAREPGPPTQQ
jgi:hypothetical protein